MAVVTPIRPKPRPRSIDLRQIAAAAADVADVAARLRDHPADVNARTIGGLHLVVDELHDLIDEFEDAMRPGAA